MREGPEGGYLAKIPGSVVVRAQQDTNFAVRLLNRDSREGALAEAGVELTDELDRTLDEIARMSFQVALQTLRDEGVENCPTI
jgi:DNA-binding transcriptional LysR family regulator